MENRPVRLGMIGAGNFSSAHCGGIWSAGKDICDLIAICDLDINKANLRANSYKIPHVYTDYHELLARDDIEAVTLPLPDQEHCKIACDAMRAGKHVLCEKPMALDLEECKEMVRVSRETGKILMVGQIGRYTPAFVKAKEIYDSGAIGELFLIESEYAHDYSKIPGTTYGNHKIPWRQAPEREPILGGGCHAIDLVRMIAGDPIEVFSYANNKCLTDWPIHDCSMSIMKFENGAIGKVFNSHGCKRRYTMRSVLYGTEGTIIFDNTSTSIQLFKPGFSDDPVFEKSDQRTVYIDIPVQLNNHNFQGEVTDFCNAIRENKAPITDGVSGAKTVAVGMAIIESFTTGMPVKPDYNI